MSRADYVEQADAICQTTNERQDALFEKQVEERASTGVASPAEREAFVENAGLPPLREEAARLAELGAPQGAEAEAEALVDHLEKAIREVEADPLAFAEGEITPFAPVERQARELGLELCGQP